MFNFLKKKKTITLPEVEHLSSKYDVVIHIGSPKTGSSAIQKYLVEHRSQLIELGYYYPKHGLDQNGISGGHSIIGKNLLDGKIAEAKAVFRTFLSEAEQRKCTLLLSAESFFYKPNELKSIIENYRCKIIAFFRDPIDAIYSAYNQAIKRHYATTRLKNYCQNIINQPAKQFSGESFQEWANAFGKEHLTVIGYDLDLFKQTPIQSVFLSIIGIPTEQQSKHFKFNHKFVNNSYCLAALELKRMLNFVLDREQTKYNESIDYFLQQRSDNYTGIKFQLADRLSPKTLHELNKKFTQSNQFIRDSFLLKINAQFLSAQNTPTVKAIPPMQVLTQTHNIINDLREQNLPIYQYIEGAIEKAINQNTSTYEVFKLAEIFNFDINQIAQREVWFTPNQLNKMTEFKQADFFREIANLCFKRGDLQNAERLIEQALIHRPNGPGIINLAQKIKEKRHQEKIMKF